MWGFAENSIPILCRKVGHQKKKFFSSDTSVNQGSIDSILYYPMPHRVCLHSCSKVQFLDTVFMHDFLNKKKKKKNIKNLALQILYDVIRMVHIPEWIWKSASNRIYDLHIFCLRIQVQPSYAYYQSSANFRFGYDISVIVYMSYVTG